MKRRPVRRTNLTASLTPGVGRPPVPVLDQPGWGRKRRSHAGRTGAWAAPDSLSPGDARPHLSFCPAALALPAAGRPRSGQGFLAEGRARRPFPWSWRACISRRPGERSTRSVSCAFLPLPFHPTCQCSYRKMGALCLCKNHLLWSRKEATI